MKETERKGISLEHFVLGGLSLCTLCRRIFAMWGTTTLFF